MSSPMIKRDDPTIRLRRAYRVQIPGYSGESLIFALTTTDARVIAFREFEVHRNNFPKIRAYRWYDKDQRLPIRHELADKVSEEALSCLTHALGVNEYEPWKPFSRDYFCADPKYAPMLELVKFGMATDTGPRTTLTDGSVYFRITDLGREVAMSVVPLYAPK